jgi:hypothetical protein
MTLTLTYELPDPVEWWLLAIITAPVVQSVVRGRMRAGMVRFGNTIRAEHDAARRAVEEAAAHAENAAAR